MVHTTHLSTKLLLTIVPLIFVALGTSVYLNNRYQEQVMLDQARASAKTYSDIIRESLVDMMLTKERVDDAYLARLNSIPDIQNLRIHFTTAGLHLRESFNQEERLARLKKREQPVATLSPNEQQVFRTGEPIWELKENMFKALIPFKAVAKCQNCHAVPLNHVLGAAEMDISLERISASVKDNWLRSFVVFLMFTSVAIALSIIMYRTLLARRLNKLLEATKLIGSGNLETPLTTDTSGDELDELTNALDMMRIRLRKAQQQIIHSDRLAT
ncbi:MAG: HAMP domain-containing protein, partial [Ignavibacteriales bacterium]|nr:HAMP domain-containing protein [Ignavibacteriales bacterium]